MAEIALPIYLWIVRTLASLVVLCTALPFVRHGAWWIRAWDFPRVQVLALGLVVIAGTILISSATRWRLDMIAVAAACSAAVIIQAAQVAPYTTLWPKSVPTTRSDSTSLLVVNLDVRNDRKDEVAASIRGVDADLLLVIELDEHWEDGLRALRSRYPHRVGVTRSEGLGIALWSKLPLKDARVEHLVSDRRASVHATVQPARGPSFRFVGVHPTPPGLAVQQGEGRYDSRIRDAELLLIADAVGDARSAGDDTPWIIAGDFNDVAWSHATRRFQRVSGLLDPRVGRGLMNTYHARYPLLRYPLDHVFMSPSFGVGSMERVRVPGSDHFAVWVDFSLLDTMAKSPQTKTVDEQDITETIREGVSNAQERGEQAE